MPRILYGDVCEEIFGIVAFGAFFGFITAIYAIVPDTQAADKSDTTQ